MAKLKDVLEGTGGGNEWFTPEQIEKQTVTITENIHPDNEIREHKSKKTFKNNKGEEKPGIWYCIEITDGKEQKDLHLTWTGLTQLADKMPKTEPWKGYQFVIDVVRAKGKLDIRVIGKVAVEQSRLQTGSDKAAADITTPAGKLLFLFHGTPAGLTDKAFWDYAVEIFGSVGAASEAVGKLKTEGKIVQDREGMWKVPA